MGSKRDATWEVVMMISRRKVEWRVVGAR